MAEECADCGATFSTPAELVKHMSESHAGGSAQASLAMNPEAEKAGLVCALCGKRFTDKQALARHNLSPHFRSNRSRAQVSSYQAIY
jgi:uncharacterized C2H2 Zn-finger protein